MLPTAGIGQYCRGGRLWEVMGVCGAHGVVGWFEHAGMPVIPYLAAPVIVWVFAYDSLDTSSQSAGWPAVLLLCSCSLCTGWWPATQPCQGNSADNSRG